MYQILGIMQKIKKSYIDKVTETLVLLVRKSLTENIVLRELVNVSDFTINQ